MDKDKTGAAGEEIKLLKGAVQDLIDKLRGLGQSAENFGKCLDVLQDCDESESVSLQNERLREINSSLDSQIDELRRALAEADQRIELLEEDKKRLEAANLGLQAEKERAAQGLREVSTALLECDRVKTGIEAEKAVLARNLADCRDGQEKCQEMLRAKCQAMEELHGEKIELERETAHLAEECDRLKHHTRELQMNSLQLQHHISDLQIQAEQLKAEFLPCQDELNAIRKIIEEMPENFRSRAREYFHIDNLPVFLSQCGQFELIAQFWRACHDIVAKEGQPQSMEPFLELTLECYNHASPRNMGREILPKTGDWYDAATQEYIGSQHSGRVARVVLPGLIRPSGVIAVKALVMLTPNN